MKGLSDKQQRMLDFINEFVDDKGYPPTVRDILRGCEISSTSVVDYNLRVLEREGYLRRDSEVSRGIGIPDRARSNFIKVPILGTIAAGQPIEAIPGQDEINLSDFLMGPDRFALRVQGSSMINAGILDGDIAVIKQQSNAHNGDIVVALIDNNEATLKKFERMEYGNIKLIPANETMQAMIYEADRVQIQGILVGSLRRY